MTHIENAHNVITEMKPIIAALASNPEVINFNDDGRSMMEIAEQLVSMAQCIAIKQQECAVLVLEEAREFKSKLEEKEFEDYDSVASI